MIRGTFEMILEEPINEECNDYGDWAGDTPCWDMFDYEISPMWDSVAKQTDGTVLEELDQDQFLNLMRSLFMMYDPTFGDMTNSEMLANAEIAEVVQEFFAYDYDSNSKISRQEFEEAWIDQACDRTGNFEGYEDSDGEECMCFANREETEFFCQDEQYRYDLEMCVLENHGDCHWGPNQQCSMQGQAMISEELEYYAVMLLEELQWTEWESITLDEIGYLFEHILNLIEVSGQESEAEAIMSQFDGFDTGELNPENINRYGSQEQKLVESALNELLNLLITSEETSGFGAMEEEDDYDDYIDYERMGYVYYCSNNGEDYAFMMGGIVCPEGSGTTPTCPDGNLCECINSDGTCEDGNDDWGYLPEEFRTTFEDDFDSEELGFEKMQTTETGCPWAIRFRANLDYPEPGFEFIFCAQDEWAHSDAWQQVSPSEPMMSTLYVFCLEYGKSQLPLPSFCDYDGSIQESTTDTTDVDETDVTTDTTTIDSTEDQEQPYTTITQMTVATCPWQLMMVVETKEDGTLDFVFCGPSEYAHSDAWVQTNPAIAVMPTYYFASLYVMCTDDNWDRITNAAKPDVCSYDGQPPSSARRLQTTGIQQINWVQFTAELTINVEMEKINDFEVFREVYESIEYWNKRTFTDIDLETGSDEFIIIYTNPNWKNIETGEKTNEVGLHFTANDCSLTMQVEANDAAQSEDENYWVIQPTGEQISGLMDTTGVCHYAAKFRLNKKAGAREVGLVYFSFRNSDGSVEYGNYGAAFFILDQKIDEYYKLSMGEIMEYAETELDKDLFVIDIDVASTGLQDPITASLGDLLGFQFKSENPYVTVNTQAKMIDEATIAIVDKFVTNVYDEDTMFTNHFFSLKPVTFSGDRALIEVEFEFTIYDSIEEIFDNKRNQLDASAQKKLFSFMIETTEVDLPDIARLTAAAEGTDVLVELTAAAEDATALDQGSTEGENINIEVYEGQSFGWMVSSDFEGQTFSIISAFTGDLDECMNTEGDLVETDYRSCFNGWDYFSLANFNEEVASNIQYVEDGGTPNYISFRSMSPTGKLIEGEVTAIKVEILQFTQPELNDIGKRWNLYVEFVKPPINGYDAIMEKYDTLDYGEGFFVPEYDIESDGQTRDIDVAYGDEVGFFFIHVQDTASVDIKCRKLSDDNLILRRSEDQAVGVTFLPPDVDTDDEMYAWYTAYEIVGKEGSASVLCTAVTTAGSVVNTVEYSWTINVKNANEVAGNLQIRRIHHSAWGEGTVYDLFLWEEWTDYGAQCRFAIGSADNTSPDGSGTCEINEPTYDSAGVLSGSYKLRVDAEPGNQIVFHYVEEFGWGEEPEAMAKFAHNSNQFFIWQDPANFAWSYSEHSSFDGEPQKLFYWTEWSHTGEELCRWAVMTPFQQDDELKGDCGTDSPWLSLDIDEEKTKLAMEFVEDFGWDEFEPDTDEKYVINGQNNEPIFWIWIPIEYFEPIRKDIQAASIWHEHWGTDMRDSDSLQSVFFFTECYDELEEECHCRFAIGSLESNHEAGSGWCWIESEQSVTSISLWFENRPEQQRLFLRSEGFNWEDEPNTEDKFIEVNSNNYEPLRDGDNFYIWGTSAAEVDEGLDVTAESEAFMKLAYVYDDMDVKNKDPANLDVIDLEFANLPRNQKEVVDTWDEEIEAGSTIGVLMSSKSNTRVITAVAVTNITKSIFEDGPLQSATMNAKGENLAEGTDPSEGAYFWLSTFKVDESATNTAVINITFTSTDAAGVVTTSLAQIIYKIKKSPYEFLKEQFEDTDFQRVIRLDDLEDYNEFRFKFEVGKKVGFLFTSAYPFSDFMSYQLNQPKFAAKRTVDGAVTYNWVEVMEMPKQETTEEGYLEFIYDTDDMRLVTLFSTFIAEIPVVEVVKTTKVAISNDDPIATKFDKLDLGMRINLDKANNQNGKEFQIAAEPGQKLGLMFFSRSVDAIPVVTLEGAMEEEKFGTTSALSTETYTDEGVQMKRWLVASRVWDDAVDGFLGTATLTFMFPATETAAARQAAYTIHMTVGVESVDVTDGAVGVDIDEMISYDEMVKRSNNMDHPTIQLNYDTLTKNLDMPTLAVNAGDTIGFMTQRSVSNIITAELTFIGNDHLNFRKSYKAEVDLTLQGQESLVYDFTKYKVPKKAKTGTSQIMIRVMTAASFVKVTINIAITGKDADAACKPVKFTDFDKME